MCDGVKKLIIITAISVACTERKAGRTTNSSSRYTIGNLISLLSHSISK